MTIEELEQRQAEIRTRLQEIDSEAEGEIMRSESRDEWNSLNEERLRNDELLTELVGRRNLLSELGGEERHREEAVPEFHTRRPGATRAEDIWDLSTVRTAVSSPEEASRELRDRARRAVDQATFPHERADRPAVQTHIEQLLERKDGRDGAVSRHILTTGSPTYRRAFAKTLAGQSMSPEEQRALSLTNEAGGYAVPFQLDPTVILTSNGVVNPIRELARVESITTDTWKGVTSAGITASYDAEATQVGDDAPELGQPELSTEKAQAFVPYSIEVGQDWGGLEAEMSRMLTDAKDTLEAEKFLEGEGSGSNEPAGLLKGAEEVKETATKETFAEADVYTLKGALPARFVPNATWLANDAIYDKVRQFDESGGAGLWARLSEGRPPEMLGKPARELSTMATAINAEEKKILIYGDFRYFLIVERLGMTIELVPHVFGANNRPVGQRGLYAYWRNSSVVLTKAAFRVLKVKKE